jgi:hypothetical protein
MADSNIILKEESNRLLFIRNGTQEFCYTYSFTLVNGIVRILPHGYSGLEFSAPVASFVNTSAVAYDEDPLKALLAKYQGPPKTVLNFSETEQNTGMKWIDGSDIFQQTLQQGVLAGDTAIIEFPAESIISVDGVCNILNQQVSLVNNIYWEFYTISQELVLNSNLAQDCTVIASVKYTKP